METISFEQLPSAVTQLSNKLERIEKLLLQKHESSENEDNLLTVHQAADFLHLTVPTIYSKVSKGELPVMKRSNRLYFSQIELTEYIKAGRKKTNDEIEVEELLVEKRKRGIK